MTADSNGNVTHSFNLPDWFVSDYDVTATGAQSGTVTTTFTDQSRTYRRERPICRHVADGLVYRFNSQR